MIHPLAEDRPRPSMSGRRFKMRAPMWHVPVDRGRDGHDAGRVYALVALVVVQAVVLHVDRVRDAGLLVEIQQIAPQIGVVADAPQAALEVLMAELPDVMERTVKAAFERAVELGR